MAVAMFTYPVVGPCSPVTPECVVIHSHISGREYLKTPRVRGNVVISQHQFSANVLTVGNIYS